MVDWQQVQYVFLDMDGTLLDLHFDNYFWLEYVPYCYGKARSLSVGQAKEQLYGRYRELRGRLEWYCVDYWTQELELDIAALKRDVSHKIAVHPEVEPFLAAVRNAGKRLVLLTNAHGKSVEIKLDKTGLQRYFDRVITSHQLGLPKEDPEFWPCLQDYEPHNPAMTLFVDDNLDVLRSAALSGISHLVAVRSPDSRGEDQHTAEFLGISGFADLLPVG